jgi:hypothetical protein
MLTPHDYTKTQERQYPMSAALADVSLLHLMKHYDQMRNQHLAHPFAGCFLGFASAPAQVTF